MTVIHKTANDWRVDPNLTDYEQTRATFDWSTAPDPCLGMASGGCNIAYAAVDRHANGPSASRTALRFVSAPGVDSSAATHDVSYAELARLSRRFTNVLRSLGVSKGDRVFTLMGRSPELYISILGALRNGSVVSPLFSAFGPEPIATRLVVSSMVLSSDRPMTTRTMPPTRKRFHRPVVVMIRPVTMLDTNRPPTIAIDIRPASVGVIPREIWKYWLR